MSDILGIVRTAFDGGDVTYKNRALRKAHDEIERLRSVPTVGLTDDETLVLKSLIDTWNKFVLRLPIEHPDDTDEFRHHIHALQMMIMARPVRRGLNRKVPE